MDSNNTSGYFNNRFEFPTSASTMHRNKPVAYDLEMNKRSRSVFRNNMNNNNYSILEHIRDR